MPGRRYDTGPLTGGMPNAGTILVDQAGRPTPIFFRLLERLFKRTGGESDAIYDLAFGLETGTPLALFAASLDSSGRTVVSQIGDAGDLARLDAGEGLSVDTSAGEVNANLITVFGLTGRVGIEDLTTTTAIDTVNDFIVIYDSDATSGSRHKRISPNNANFGNSQVIETLSLEVRDDTTNDQYTVNFGLGAGVSNANNDIQFLLFRGGDLVSIQTTASPTSTSSYLAFHTSGGDGSQDNHFVIANLLNTTGETVYSVTAYAQSVVAAAILKEDDDFLLTEDDDLLLQE